MNETRKLEIDTMVQSITKNLEPEKIGFIGVLLWSIVKKESEKLSSKEIEEIEKIANDPDDDYFPECVKKFLLEISNNPAEIKYFVSQMQNNIIKELESCNEISCEEIERLRDFFSMETLEKLNINRQDKNIRILIIAVCFDKTIPFEENRGLSEKIDNLIKEIPIEDINDIAESFGNAFHMICNF